MSTTEQPDSQPLTRKQMRDLRNTGSTPVVTPEVAAPAPPPAPAPLPRAAEPVIVPAAPVADSAVDLGVSPLTRRQARQQERIRTASVPVITPEIAAAHAAGGEAAASGPAPASPQTATAALRDLFGPPVTATAAPPAPHRETPEIDAPDAEVAAVEASDSPWAPVKTERLESSPVATIDDAPARTADEPEADESVEPDADVDTDASHGAGGVLNPLFGAGLIADAPATPAVTTPPSFDQLLSRSSTGSIGTSNALILDTTGEAPMVGPVTATGEVLITGTFALPEGLGSTGVPQGSADGKEVDATLVDGELPAHSSPTPIAASSAISTVKSTDEVIRPPVPEKGSRLMLTLAITAGVLALALVGVLILAFVTGVF